MTTELIKELAGLCATIKSTKIVSLKIETGGSLTIASIQIGSDYYKEIFLSSDSACDQLQSAIDRVRAL